MPIARNYKPGSIVYFEGDKNSEEIYILQNGKIVLVSSPIIQTELEVKETITNGEFFGVKSALGRYPREETAQVITPCVVLVLTQDEFEQMVLKNFRVLLKMLKVFSNQLRRIGKTVRDIMHKGEPKMPSTELFYIGEYYVKQGKADQAKYVYEKYLSSYPDGQFADTAKQRLDAVERGDLRVEPVPSLKKEAAAPAGGDVMSFDQGAVPGLQAAGGAEEKKPDGVRSATEGIDVTKKYYEGLSLFSQEKFQEAIDIYQSIAAMTKFKDETTAKFAEKALFELGRCQMKLNKPLEAIETFSNLIKKFQRTDLLKDALFAIGEAYEKLNKYDKAINFYQKVVNTPPKESINTKAKKALEEAQKKL
ncbi:MAG: tetratricopeptide repeat protein [bacterium]|nr:tetratricopeptide repeat protein [bacterium]